MCYPRGKDQSKPRSLQATTHDQQIKNGDEKERKPNIGKWPTLVDVWVGLLVHRATSPRPTLTSGVQKNIR